MKSLVVVALCVSLLAPGCAVRSSSLHPGVRLDGNGSVQGEIPRAYAEQLPVGKEVDVRLRSGEHFKGTYMGMEGHAIRVQPSTRIPVPPRLVPLDEVTQLRLASGGGGGSVAKAIIIGAATGAAVFFGLLLVSVAAWAD